jgi:hypothetical protein
MEDPFSYRPTKSGDVQIFRGGTIVVTLRGRAAEKFLATVGIASEEAQQHAMARVTGNYKRGNERQVPAKLTGRRRR